MIAFAQSQHFDAHLKDRNSKKSLPKKDKIIDFLIWKIFHFHIFITAKCVFSIAEMSIRRWWLIIWNNGFHRRWLGRVWRLKRGSKRNAFFTTIGNESVNYFWAALRMRNDHVRGRWRWFRLNGLFRSSCLVDHISIHRRCQLGHSCTSSSWPHARGSTCCW